MLGTRWKVAIAVLLGIGAIGCGSSGHGKQGADAGNPGAGGSVGSWIGRTCSYLEGTWAGNEMDPNGANQGPITMVVHDDQVAVNESVYNASLESYTLTAACKDSVTPNQITGTIMASIDPEDVGQPFYAIYELDTTTRTGRLSGLKPGATAFPTTFAAGNGQRLFVFTGWIHQSAELGQQDWRSVASSADGTKLVAVTNDFIAGGYTFTSADSGASWQQQTSTQQRWESVASSADGTKLVAATSPGYIYVSADSGVTWTQTGAQQYWSSLASSADGTNLVAVSNDFPGGGYIYTSADSGATWTQQTSTQQHWQSVASSVDGTKLVAVSSGGVVAFTGHIHTSADSGATWTQTGTQQYWQAVASSADGTKLVAVAYGDYIYTYSSPVP